MNRTDRAAAGLVLGIGAGAFALSYEALYGVSVGAGVNDKLGHAYPLIVEGFVTVSTWVAYRLRNWGWKATAYPWVLSALFFAFSVWANSLPHTVPAPIVRGVPSVALGFAAHLFAHMTKNRAAELVELVDATDEETEAAWEEPWPAWEAPAAVETGDMYGDDAETGTVSIFAPQPRKRVAVAAHATDSDAFLIRSWGREHGFTVKDTGRIPEQVLKAYAKAHGGELITS